MTPIKTALLVVVSTILTISPLNAVTLKAKIPKLNPDTFDANKVVIFLNIKGYQANNGPIFGSVYAKEEGFLDGKSAVHTFKINPETSHITINLPALDKGRYALALFHDINQNGKLDRNFIGIPKEPYAFSNDARGSFGPPKFDKAAVEFEKSGQRVTITFI